jgi:hypothetical protein
MSLKKNNLLALCGLAGSGKTFASNMLIDQWDFHRLKFAGPIKDMLTALGLTKEYLEGCLKEEPTDMLCGKSPRQAMQTLGTEWGRTLMHPNFWVQAWKNRARATLYNGFKVVVDDCRFQNEEDAVRELGGKIILINRPGIQPVASHISEQFVPKADFVIENSGSIFDLRVKLQDIMKSLE